MQFFVQELVNGLTLGIAYAVMGVGLTLVFGILRIMTFAHGEFYALGAYGVIAMGSVLGLPYWGAAPFSVLFAGLVAALVYVVLIRPASRRYGDQGMAALLVTYGLSLIGVNAFQLIAGPNPRFLDSGVNSPVIIHGIVIPEQRLLIAAVGFGLLGALGFFLKVMARGRELRAVAQSQLGAALVGIRVRRVQLFAFSIGSALAAFAGILVAPTGLVTPDIGQNILFKSFIVVILGGLGSVGGAAIAGVLLGVVEALGGGYFNSQWSDAYGWALLLIVLVLRPSGFFGAAAVPVGRGFLWPRRRPRLVANSAD